MNWYQSGKEDVIKELQTGDKGLNTEEATRRLAEYGPNSLEAKQQKTAWQILLAQFKDFMIVILMVAAIVSGVAGDLSDAIIIVVIVLLNAVIGFIQEYRAEKAMEALRNMATPQAKVIRNGQQSTIPADQLVPGDWVILEAGDMVPADLRLTDIHALRIDEAPLTGESVPVDKSTDPIKENEPPLGDRINIAYKSTLVTNGRGAGVIVSTGMKTEIGRIAGMLQGEEGETPLQKRMGDFGKKLTWMVVGICVVLFVTGLLQGEKPVQMLLVATSLAVAAIPEALPALITIALARGAKRLVKQQVLIRKLPAVETLGSVSFICTDKTGTLTQNKMEVVKVEEAGDALKAHDSIPLLVLAMALNQDAQKDDKDEWKGDPTEIAMIRYALEKHPEEAIKQVQEQFKRESEIPFDSDRKRMSTIHRFNDKFLLITKGATEAIASRLKDSGKQQEILDQSVALSKEGMRVLAYAYRVLDSVPNDPKPDDIEKDLDFAGMTGLIDPPREEVKPAIQECKKAGIQPVMITGDHRETAAAIGRDIGLLEEGDLVLSGTELNELSESELDAKVEKVRVYARVSPEQKLNIVKSLQRKGHFAAMTGDGVNDAPSLRTANIGIAMGITGTDVSKEAAHMILLDDNFATIIRAVKEGRRIYDNIRKFVKYIMTCNGAEIWTIFLAPFFGLPIPLQPVHILWINLVTDGLPGLALAAERAEKNVMLRPPAKSNASLFAHGTGYHIIWVGLLMTAVTLGTQAWAIQTEHSHWQTMVFTVLSVAQLGHVMAIRSDELILSRGIFSNLPLIGALILTFALQLGVIYLPFANAIFHTQPLTLSELLICIAAAAVVFHAVEFEKVIKRSFSKRKQRSAK